MKVSEVRYRRLFETAKDGILLLDADTGKITDANPFMCASLGYSHDEFLGKELWEIGLFKDKEASQTAVRELQEKHYSRYDDLPLKTKAGRRIDVEFVSNVYTEDHEPVIQCNIRDITERKRSEELLRASEEFSRTVLESSPDCVKVLDADGRLLMMNANGACLMEIDDFSLFRGKDWTSLWPNETQARVAEAVAAAKGGATDRFQAFSPTAKGTPKWWDVIVSPVRDGGGAIVRLVSASRDITERKRAEEALRQSEADLARELVGLNHLHELVARLVVCHDLQPALNEVLEATIEMMGADFGNVQLFNPQNNRLEIVAHRGYKEDFLDHFRTVSVDDGAACGRAMNAGERVIIEDVQTDAGYEPHRHIALSNGLHGVQSTPLLGRNGKVLGMLSTHYRRPHRPSERDLRILDLYARQAADFIERTRTEAALRQVADDLSEADRRKTEFLALLAHELRNPLAPIHNAVQVLRRTSSDGEAVTSASEMMERQVGQLARLVDDLLDVSRISRGKIELRRGRVELASVVNHAVEAARPLAQDMEHDLTIRLPPQPIYLYADPTRLAQVVGNLINNACKFTDKGGRIVLAVECEGEQAVIRLRDSGIGIAADQLPRIFDMFVQVDTSLERSVSGLGIGLTLVKNLVEMHGGTVAVQSDGPGNGSEFVVRIPIMVETPKPPPEPTVRETAPTAIRRILVVDDNRDSAESLAMLLEMTGNTTHAAYDGLEAVEAAESFKPDVVLLDIGLPKLNGYEAARRIREQAWGKDMVLVALTGWGQEEDRQKSKEAGFDDHMVKPVEYHALMKLLAEVDAG